MVDILLIILGIFIGVIGFIAAVLWLVIVIPIALVLTITISPFKQRKEISKDSCPVCSSPLHPIRSQFLKMCGSCDYQEQWDLKEGQKPLVSSNRDTRKNMK